MNIQKQIDTYISSLEEPKRSELLNLHKQVCSIQPQARLWFFDGRNAENKVVANPSIGYGSYTIQYADGSSREFYQIGLSANKTGISVYILGLKDKEFLAQTYGTTIGKANVSGYCIRFKKLQDIQLDVLLSAVRYGLEYKQ